MTDTFFSKPEVVTGRSKWNKEDKNINKINI